LETYQYEPLLLVEDACPLIAGFAVVQAPIKYGVCCAVLEVALVSLPDAIEQVRHKIPGHQSPRALVPSERSFGKQQLP